MSNEALIDEIDEMIAGEKAISLADKDFLKDVKVVITRLLAIEVAAKKMAKNFIMYKETGQSFYCPRCDAEHDSPKKIKHTATCPVLIINPIGDTK